MISPRDFSNLSISLSVYLSIRQSVSLSIRPSVCYLSSSIKNGRARGLHPSSRAGNQRGAETGPQGGLPTDVSELRGGLHLRLYTRRRRHQRQDHPLSRNSDRKSVV